MGRSRSRSPSRRRRDKDRSERRKKRRSREREKERAELSHRSRHQEHSRERDFERSRSRDRDRSRSGRRSRSRSRSHSHHRSHRYGSPSRSSRSDRPQISEADLEGKTAEEIDMMKTMGFCSFDTTKNKKVEGNDVGDVHVILKRKYRQYMNRKGGFNRPLDFVA